MLTRLASIVLLLIACASVQTTHGAGNPTDGRLGGTYASFIDRFGEPTELVPGLGHLFDLPDTRYVAVQFDPSENTFPDDAPALVITVSADRDEARPAAERDPGDWSRETAEAIAADLAPTDAEFDALDESGADSATTTCRSDALLAAFGVVSLGECRITYLLSSETTVSFVTLTLTSGAEVGLNAASPEAACAGVVEWAELSSERLAAAQELLDALATLSDDPAEAVPTLRQLAADLESLADEQRTATTPREVATANYYIIGALTDFAAAITLAADGLEDGDQAVVDEAVDDLDDADARAADASAEIATAVTDCDLVVGTPEAG